MKNFSNKTKENLVQAFMKIYKDKPIEKISVKEIIFLAGYNRSTFYFYFENVSDILNFAEENLIEKVRKNILENSTIDDNSDEIIKKIVKIYEDDGENLSIMLKSQKFVEKYKEILKPAFMKHFKFSERQKNFQTEINFEFAISAIIGAFNFWYKNSEKISAEKFIKQVRENLKKIT